MIILDIESGYDCSILTNSASCGRDIVHNFWLVVGTDHGAINMHNASECSCMSYSCVSHNFVVTDDDQDNLSSEQIQDIESQINKDNEIYINLCDDINLNQIKITNN